MDSIEQRQIILDHYEEVEPISYSHKLKSKASTSQKLDLINKIKQLSKHKDNLKLKQQSLQNNVADLRKLLEAAGKENNQYMEKIEEQISELNSKASRVSSALKYSFRDGNHFQNCAFYWKEFVE